MNSAHRTSVGMLGVWMVIRIQQCSRAVIWRGFVSIATQNMERATRSNEGEAAEDFYETEGFNYDIVHIF